MSADVTPELHEWDAAYVLGALSAAERAQFEQHLETCAECREAVAGFAVLPGLLAKVAPEDLPNFDEPDAGAQGTAAPLAAAPRDERESLQTLAHRVRRRRGIRRWITAGGGVLAAAAIAAALVLPARLDAPPRPSASITLEQTAPGPLSATVGLTTQKWGTSISVKCTYAGAPGAYAVTGRYVLYVTDANGVESPVASWTAMPGQTIHANGAIETPVSQLRMIELRDAATGAILLTGPVS